MNPFVAGFSRNIALKLLQDFKVKHPGLQRKLADLIRETGKIPKIKIVWDSSKQDIDFEVIS